MIDLVYQDSHFIIVNKPAGLLCVPGLSDPDNLHDRVLIYFPNARVVHRLDMATSGLVIFALNYESQRQLGKLFEHRKIKKEYIANINGVLDYQYGEVHSPMICDWENRPKQKLDWINGKPASTSFSLLSLDKRNNASRVQLKPVTGRTHQLRLHMLQIGHPIVGDKLYCSNTGYCAKDSERMQLHASLLEFTHPLENKTLKIQIESDF